MSDFNDNPYAPPESQVEAPDLPLQYVGFWLRTLATLIDTVLIMLLTFPLLLMVYGAAYLDSTDLIEGPLDLLISYVLPAIVVVLFWTYRSATPGKMMIGAKIVDADTGERPTIGRLIGRYLGYYLSSLPLGLGFLWIAWDGRKQGWHDKLARTAVVRATDQPVPGLEFRPAPDWINRVDPGTRE